MPPNISQKDKQAIIFDFDGIITDTEPVHMKAWLSILRPIGISFGKKEYYNHYLGLNDRDFLSAVGRLHKHAFSAQTKERLIRQKLKKSIALLSKRSPFFPGVKRIIRKLSTTHLLAISSGANKKEILYILKKTGWTNLFDPIITGEDVKFGKPDPEGYKLVIRRLIKKYPRLSILDCLAVEDSPKGITAAHAAGIKCLAISNSYPKRMLKNADWIKKSLSAFDFSRQLKKTRV